MNCQSSLNVVRLEFWNAGIRAVHIYYLCPEFFCQWLWQGLVENSSLPWGPRVASKISTEHRGLLEWTQPLSRRQTQFCWSGNGTPVRFSVLLFLGMPQLSPRLLRAEPLGASACQPTPPCHTPLTHQLASLVSYKCDAPDPGEMCHKGETAPGG